MNSSGETPVLKHKDKILNESVAIMEYIDKELGSKRILFPEDIEDKVKTALKLVEEEWRPAFSRVLLAPAPLMQKEWRPKLFAAFDKIEAQCDGGQ
jgi:glutathione S-transferase